MESCRFCAGRHAARQGDDAASIIRPASFVYALGDRRRPHVLRRRLNPLSSLEACAVMLGLANILLLVRRSIWNYAFGIATVLLYAWIFTGARLYSDALLQLFFLALNIYGWLNWARAKQADGIPVRWLGGTRLAVSAGLALVATLLWGTIMHSYTDAARPWWDGAVAMMSLLAQALLARRYIDNWIWWIIVDLAAIPLYASKGLLLTAGLYLVFLLLSVAGLIGWIGVAKSSNMAPA